MFFPGRCSLVSANVETPHWSHLHCADCSWSMALCFWVPPDCPENHCPALLKIQPDSYLHFSRI